MLINFTWKFIKPTQCVYPQLNRIVDTFNLILHSTANKIIKIWCVSISKFYIFIFFSRLNIEWEFSTDFFLNCNKKKSSYQIQLSLVFKLNCWSKLTWKERKKTINFCLTKFESLNLLKLQRHDDERHAHTVNKNIFQAHSFCILPKIQYKFKWFDVYNKGL